MSRHSLASLHGNLPFMKRSHAPAQRYLAVLDIDTEPFKAGAMRAGQLGRNLAGQSFVGAR
jgi:hypothetical protein